MNAAKARWFEMGQRLAASYPERVALAARKGAPCPTPRQVRAAIMDGTSAGANARRWLAEGWRSASQG